MLAGVLAAFGVFAGVLVIRGLLGSCRLFSGLIRCGLFRRFGLLLFGLSAAPAGPYGQR